MNPDILTPADTAKYLKVSQKTVRRLAQSGELPHFRIGSLYRFEKDAVILWARKNGPGKVRHVTSN